MSAVPNVSGLLLAAGQGSRLGEPKAAVDVGGTLLAERAVDALLAGGCRDVLLVTGAQARTVEDRLTTALAPWADRVAIVECVRWENGVSASLGTGLATLAARGRRCPLAAVVHLVDLPDVGADVVARVLHQARRSSGLPDVLARASFAGRAGHPAVIGQNHWQGVMDTARGDRGAGRYLREQQAELVECGDLAHGRDVDTPEELAAYLASERHPGDGPR
jgi:CTP:molybdopterin cytidylyltransferase MocA